MTIQMTEPGFAPKRHPDSDLLGSAGDDEGHDAVESNGGEQRRERAESRGKHRDQTFGEQRLDQVAPPASASETLAWKRPAFSPSLRSTPYSEAGGPADRT